MIFIKQNIGDTDKVVRLIVGLVIVGLGIYFKSWLGIIGIIPIITGLLNYCPCYHLLGRSTSKTPAKPE